MARVVLNGVHIDFPIYGTQNRSLRNAIYQRATGGVIKRDAERSDRVVVKALSGISMHLEEGDRLGLVGHNGSGKSTLLKAIAGIYEPNQGSLLVEGRVTPLFDMMPVSTSRIRATKTSSPPGCCSECRVIISKVK